MGWGAMQAMWHNNNRQQLLLTSSSWNALFHWLLQAGPLRSPPAPRDIAPSTSAMLASVRAAIPAD